MLDRHHTATHEAGHAVMAARLGEQVYAVTIVPDEEAGSLGASTDESADWCPESAETYALICLAGCAAVAAAGLPDPEAGGDDDFEKADAVIENWSMAPIAELKARALEIMREARNVRAVEIIAARLERDGHIDGQTFPNVLAFADGEISAEDLAAWDAMVAQSIAQAA